MRAISLRLLSLAALTLLLFSCKKETEDFQLTPLSEYYPLVLNKYITYRVDSTVFTNFGRNMEVRYFDEKHVVDAKITDNTGREGYRVLKFQRDTSGSGYWKPVGSYAVYPSRTQIEVNTDNFRQLKLVLPLQQDFSWKGNRFLLGNPGDPYGTVFSFSNDDYMSDWDFTYTGVNETERIGRRMVQDVVTVSQVDEAINVPIVSPGAYASLNFAVDKYAKGIGPVYQELIMWEYQPNTGGPSPYRIGFGVKRSMIDHN